MKSNWSRREFTKLSLISGVGLTIGATFISWKEKKLSIDLEEKSFEPNLFISVKADNTIKLSIPKTEMGQGVLTTGAILIAEELSIDFDKIKVKSANHNLSLAGRLGNQNTGGSTSVKDLWKPMRIAAAAVREMLITAAAKKWNVPLHDCKIVSGKVVSKNKIMSLTFGELASLASMEEVPTNPSLKSTTNFKVIGSPKIKIETKELVSGKSQYGIDIEFPNMLYAVIERAPVFGSKIVSIDDSKTKQIAGIKDIIQVSSSFTGARVKNGVAVVANSIWAAMKGREAISIIWDNDSVPNESSELISNQMKILTETNGRIMSNIGDVNLEFAIKENDTLESTYETPFLSHAQMEPMSCTAKFEDEKCILWSGTQFPRWAVMGVARTLGLKPADITINITNNGGAFGRKITFDYVVEAAVIAKAIPRVPIKVIWTRVDDLKHGFYRPASFHRIKASVNKERGIVAWQHHLVSTTINVWGNSSNPDNECLGGGAGDLVYNIPNIKTMYSGAKSKVPRGWWRSVEYGNNVFPIECCIDEISYLTNQDPLDYRINLIKNRKVFKVTHPFWGTKSSQPRRHANVLTKIKELTGWSEKKKNKAPIGVASLYHFGLDSCIAVVTEMHTSIKKASVKKMTAVVDCGKIVNPLGVKAQIEGGLIMGISSAIGEVITIENGSVQQDSLSKYKLLRIHQAPEIEVVIIESEEAPGGVGELSVPVAAPSLCNAIFASTGKRHYKLPINI